MNKQKRKNTWSFFWFVFPALFAFLNVVVVPFIMGLVYSLTDWDGFQFAGSQFIGLGNYVSAFQDSDFHRAFGYTFIYALLMVLFVNVIGFFLAIIVNEKLWARNIWRSIYVIPNLIGGLILGFVWQFIFNRLFTQLGVATGLENIFYNWLSRPASASLALLIVGIWQQAGYTMLIYLGGLQSIPGELYESASIDGAGWWSRLKNITLPLMIPSITVNLFITMATAMKTYDTNVSLTNGNPGGRTEMMAMHIYNEAYKYTNHAEAQAKAVLFFFVIAAITLVQVYYTRKREVQL